MQNLIQFHFQGALSRDTLLWRSTMTYRTGSKSRMIGKDSNIPRTAAPWKCNTVRRIPKNLTLNQPLLMQARNRHLYPLPRLGSHLIHRQETSQRRIQDRPLVKGLRRHLRYLHHAPTLLLRDHLYRNHRLLVTSPRGRRGQVC